MFRRSGRRFADKNMRQMNESVFPFHRNGTRSSGSKSNTWCPRLTARIILSGSAVQVNGFGSALCSTTKRLMAACKSTTDTKTPRFNRRFVSLAKKPSTALSQDAEVGVKWKVQRGCRRQPLANLRMLVGRVVVDDGVDRLSGRHLRFDGVEEANELLVPVALHVMTDDGAVEDVESGEQRGRAMAFVVVGHRSGAARSSSADRAGCDRAPGFGSSHRPKGRLHGRADRHRGRRCRAACSTNCGSVESLNRLTRCGCSPCARQMRWTELALISTTFAIIAEVQWVASAGGSLWVSVTTRSVTLDPSGRIREGRVLSRRRPSYPSCMKRSCQRQTQVFDFPVRRMISLVPTPSALNSTISARQTCLCGVLRSRATPFRPTAISGLETDGYSGSHAPNSHASGPLGIPSGIQMSDAIH